METSIQYKPVKELPKSVREVASEYDRIIDQFMADEETKYAEITKEGIKTISLVSALKSRINNKKLANKVKTRQIKGKAYLGKL